MELTKKQIGIILLSAVAVTLVMLLVFALPVSGGIGEVRVNTVTKQAFEESIVPHFLDKLSDDYVKETKFFLTDDYTARSADEYAEIYVEVDLKKLTPIPFQTIWVGIDIIPEAYRDSVVCVTTGPTLTECERSSSKGNITFLVLRNGRSDEELQKLAQDITYDVKWTLAMGVDGHLTPN